MTSSEEPRSAADRLAESLREAAARSYQAVKPTIEETKVKRGPQLEAGAGRAAAFSEQVKERAEAKADEIEQGPQREYTAVAVSALKAGSAVAEAAADAARWAARAGHRWSGRPDELPPGPTD